MRFDTNGSNKEGIQLSLFARARFVNAFPQFRTARDPELTVTTGIAYRLMMLLAVTTGLRRSELFALKWSDLNFTNLTIDIKRSIFQGIVGSCKTAASRTSIPLPLFVAAELW